MQEILRATIANSNKWHNEDVEAKAKEMGMEKTEFILNAVDMAMNFDKTFIKRIQSYSEGLHIPEWLVIQNMLIKEMAKEAAEVETKTFKSKALIEFTSIGEGMNRKTLTGEELFNQLKQQYVLNIEDKKELKELTRTGKVIEENEILTTEFEE